MPRESFEELQETVELDEEIPGGKEPLDRKTKSPLFRKKLVETKRQGMNRFDCADDQKGDDRGTCPTGKLIDGDPESGGQKDKPDRHRWAFRPGDEPEEGEVDPGEDPDRADPAETKDNRTCLLQRWMARIVPCQAKGKIAFRRDR